MFINRFASYKLIKTLDKCLCLNIVHKQVVRTLSYVAQHYGKTFPIMLDFWLYFKF